jgi:hypothetical protein
MTSSRILAKGTSIGSYLIKTPGILKLSGIFSGLTLLLLSRDGKR